MASPTESFFLTRQSETLSGKKQRELALRASHGDREACWRLVLSFEKLIYWYLMKKNHLPYCLDKEEIVHICLKKLFKVFLKGKYDPSYGTKPSSYALIWIRTIVFNFICKEKLSVSVPSNISRTIYSGLSSDLTQTGIDRLIAPYPNISRPYALAAYRIYHSISLDSPIPDELTETEVGGDEEITLETITDPQDLNHGNRQTRLLLKLMIRQAIRESLDIREQVIIRLRYGIGPSKEMILREISDIIGLTRERIRQIIVKAERKMEEYLLRQPNFKLIAKEYFSN